MKKQQTRTPAAKQIIEEMRREVYKSGALRPALLAKRVLDWADRLELEISTPSNYIVDYNGDAVPLFTLPVRNPSRRELVKQRKQIESLIARVEYLERVLSANAKPVLSIVDRKPKQKD